MTDVTNDGNTVEPSAPPTETAPSTPSTPPQKPAGGKLTRAALVLGIIAAVLAIIPGPSFIAFLPALTALGFGITALVKRSPRRGRGIAGVVLGASAFLVAIIVSSAAIGGAVGTAKVSPNTNSAPSAQTSALPSVTPSQSAPPAPPATPAAPIIPADKVYTGTGDSVVKVELPDGPGVPSAATISHTGSSSNFAVWSLDANMAQQDLLVNVIGNYQGTVLFDVQNGQQTSALQITATGLWTVTLHSIKALRTFTGASATGTGDDVLIYTGTAGAAAITNTGTGNFAIWNYGTNTDLVVNEIGAYTGTDVWGPGPALIAITSDGNWSITVN